MSPLLFSFVLCGVVVSSQAQTATPSTGTDPSPTLAPCDQRSNSSCRECLTNVNCLWCEATAQCVDYPVRHILPPSSVCPLTDARWGVCWVNFQILIIVMSVLAGIVVIAVLVCCFCCCCKCERIGNKREDAQVERQTRVRKARQKAKRTEMQLRHDEIRQKYDSPELNKDIPVVSSSGESLPYINQVRSGKGKSILTYGRPLGKFKANA